VIVVIAGLGRAVSVGKVDALVVAIAVGVRLSR
jgi:hypothetical protein